MPLPKRRQWAPSCGLWSPPCSGSTSMATLCPPAGLGCRHVRRSRVRDLMTRLQVRAPPLHYPGHSERLWLAALCNCGRDARTSLTMVVFEHTHDATAAAAEDEAAQDARERLARVLEPALAGAGQILRLGGWMIGDDRVAGRSHSDSAAMRLWDWRPLRRSVGRSSAAPSTCWTSITSTSRSLSYDRWSRSSTSPGPLPRTRRRPRTGCVRPASTGERYGSRVIFVSGPVECFKTSFARATATSVVTRP